MRIVVIGGEVFIAASDAKAIVDSTTEEERLMHPVWQLHHLHDYIVGGEQKIEVDWHWGAYTKHMPPVVAELEDNEE